MVSMFACVGVCAPRFMLIAATFFTWLSAAATAAQTSSPAAVAPAQPAAESTSTICGMAVPKPAALPPATSGPVVLAIVPCFERQGGASTIDPATYLYYIRLRPSLPSQGVWTPYDDAARTQMLADFRTLWATSFLDDLRIEVIDHVLPNGVVGKLVKYDMEERQRVKIVEYTGTKVLESTKIDEKLKEESVSLRLDSFIDDRAVRRVTAIIREMLSEKGYLDSTVTPATTPIPGGAKLVNLTFTISEGPKYKIRDIDFVGNEQISDRALKRRMKETKEQWFLSFITGRGTYKQDKYGEDAEKVVGFYRDRGHLRVRVDNPELRTLETDADGKTRHVALVIPVTEGPRYRIGQVSVVDNKAVKTEAITTLLKLKKGDYYSEQSVRKGLEKARELYGAIGHFEFTAYPEFKFRDLEPETAEGGAAAGVNGAEAAPASPTAAAAAPASTTAAAARETAGAPIVDVTMHMQEGEQYFVHRITFEGNTTTKDKVIRRELRLVESGVFNTEALKYSVRRITQLGYFKPIDEQRTNDVVKVDKAPGETNKVDVTLKLEEHNRNELTFGGGVSGIDGFYLSFSYATTNFLGQGETLQVAAQRGARANIYSVSVSEPYFFDRPISIGASIFSRKVDYLMSDGRVGYSEVRTGGTGTAGKRLFSFVNAYTTYAYEVIDSAVSDDLDLSAGDPLFVSYLDAGRHIESRLSPTLIYNTVDHPITPHRGMRITGTYDVSGGLLGGTVEYIRPDAEVILYIPHTRRTALGLRGQAGWIKPYGGTEELPYYRRFFLGGETQIRGYDIRTVGPLDENNRALGGDKFVLFNAEYYIDIAGPLRFLVFHDAGQAYAEGHRINLRELRTSSGAEVRFLMPVMNVPFRLIYAWNVYRDVFQPARTFKFAVGTTF
jgi:outer membrane protein insertion porin family